MEGIKKIRLLDLISRKNEALNFSNWDKDAAYEWLEELEYLLNSLKNLGPIATKVMETIKSLRSGEIGYSTKFCQLKAQLEVFRWYEIDDTEIS